jgi:hypothetical protein
MFRIIRAGRDYGVVVVVTPEDATPESTDARFFERKDWKAGDNPVDTFYEISWKSMLCAFSGHADHWGFAEIPKEAFASLEEVNAWIEKQQGKP